jgi:hypothetical protein
MMNLFTWFPLAFTLCAASQPIAARTYWQRQQTDVTVVVEGDPDGAKKIRAIE